MIKQTILALLLASTLSAHAESDGGRRHEEKRAQSAERQGNRQEARDARSEGHLSAEERRALHDDVNRLSKDIYQDRRDDRRDRRR